MEPNEQEIKQSITTLSQSERGRQAMADVLTLLDNGAASLSESNQIAVFTLMAAAFGPKVGTAMDLMRKAVAKGL